MGYRIKSIARLTGIPRNTLLAWERRYQIVEPERGDNGYREYSDADLELLLQVKKRIDGGCKVSEAITLVRQDEAASTPEPVHTEVSSLEGFKVDLLQSLLGFDRPAAIRRIGRLPLTSYVQLVREVYLPLMREVGEGWESGQISIAQEHFATGFIRERLMAMLVSLEHGPENGRKAICAGISGERHEGGLLALAIQLALRGFRVNYLGADVPWEALGEAAQKQNAMMVCVSAVNCSDVDHLRSYAKGLRTITPETCQIVIGGASIGRLTPQPVEGVVFEGSAQRFLKENPAMTR